MESIKNTPEPVAESKLEIMKSKFTSLFNNEDPQAIISKALKQNLEIVQLAQEKKEKAFAVLPVEARSLLNEISFNIKLTTEREEVFFGHAPEEKDISNFEIIGIEKTIEKIVSQQNAWWFCEAYATADGEDISVKIESRRSGMCSYVPMVTITYKGETYNIGLMDEDNYMYQAQVDLGYKVASDYTIHQV